MPRPASSTSGLALTDSERQSRPAGFFLVPEVTDVGAHMKQECQGGYTESQP